MKKKAALASFGVMTDSRTESFALPRVPASNDFFLFLFRKGPLVNNENNRSAPFNLSDKSFSLN